MDRSSNDSSMVRHTPDGSTTLFSPQFGETYHSIHGAFTESMHVFIRTGLHAHDKVNLTIFEVGFGTGLNALLTAMECEQRGLQIMYLAIEKFPLEDHVVQQLQFPNLTPAHAAIFKKLHEAPWEQPVPITSSFSLHKIQGDLITANIPPAIDLVYFDAFSPASQPELWTDSVFQKIYACMLPAGILVTYCAKGIVRRNLQSVGFVTERLPGPPPKREMLRGSKS